MHFISCRAPPTHLVSPSPWGPRPVAPAVCPACLSPAMPCTVCLLSLWLELFLGLQVSSPPSSPPSHLVLRLQASPASLLQRAGTEDWNWPLTHQGSQRDKAALAEGCLITFALPEEVGGRWAAQWRGESCGTLLHQVPSPRICFFRLGTALPSGP